MSASTVEEQDERRVKFLTKLIETDDFAKNIFKLAERSMPLVDLS